MIGMADNKELKLETKCYDANEYGYLYGLNQRIPDDEFEKVKPYFRKFKRSLVGVFLTSLLSEFVFISQTLKVDSQCMCVCVFTCSQQP